LTILLFYNFTILLFYNFTILLLIANCGAKVRRFFDTLVSQIAAVLSLFAENVRLFIK